MDIKFQVDGFPAPEDENAANPPIVPIYPDRDVPDGVSISEVTVTVVTSNVAYTIDELSSAVLRQASVVPRRTPGYAKPAVPNGPVVDDGAGTKTYNFRLGKMSNATAGPDNQLVLWAVTDVPNSYVAQFPFVGQFGAHLSVKEQAEERKRMYGIQLDQLHTLKKDQLDDLEQDQIQSQLLAGMSQIAGSVENWFIVIFGNINITTPPEGNPTPPNVSVSPLFGMPYGSIQNVWGTAGGGQLMNAWAVVLRAGAQIPPMPTGFPTPVGASFILGSAFYFSTVPGAVLGQDNKLVVWAQFLQQPAMTIATRSFCGIS